MLRFLKYSIGSAVAAALAITGLGGLNLYTYQRWTDETPVAELAFTELGPERFEVSLDAIGREPRTLVLEGDEWQLDVRMVKWTDWLTFLGQDPLYRLDRISGRYSDIESARKKQVSMYGLTEAAGLDLWAFARRSGDWLPGIDAAYGSSVFTPMRDGARYRVTLSRTGLVARPLNNEGEG